MKKKEIIQELKRYGYSRVNIDTDRRTSKTFYTYRGGIHINGTENLSFHIVPPPESSGLGRFAICATRNGESSQLGTDHAPFFFRRLFSFIKGERTEHEMIDEICNNRPTRIAELPNSRFQVARLTEMGWAICLSVPHNSRFSTIASGNINWL